MSNQRCICCGKELAKNGNNNGISKEKKKDEVLSRGLGGLALIAKQLESLEEVNFNSETEKIKWAIKTIEDMQKQIREIDEEYNNHKDKYSGHHPVKKAIWGSNNLIPPFCKDCHTRFELNNVLKAEAMILKLRLKVYARLNVAFILNGGRDLSDSAIANIIVREEMRLRMIPKDEFRQKLLERSSSAVGRMTEIFREKLRGYF